LLPGCQSIRLKGMGDGKWKMENGKKKGVKAMVLGWGVQARKPQHADNCVAGPGADRACVRVRVKNCGLCFVIKSVGRLADALPYSVFCCDSLQQERKKEVESPAVAYRYSSQATQRTHDAEMRLHHLLPSRSESLASKRVVSPTPPHPTPPHFLLLASAARDVSWGNSSCCDYGMVCTYTWKVRLRKREMNEASALCAL
jgi:hypothetical protein